MWGSRWYELGATFLSSVVKRDTSVDTHVQLHQLIFPLTTSYAHPTKQNWWEEEPFAKQVYRTTRNETCQRQLGWCCLFASPQSASWGYNLYYVMSIQSTQTHNYTEHRALLPPKASGDWNRAGKLLVSAQGQSAETPSHPTWVQSTANDIHCYHICGGWWSFLNSLCSAAAGCVCSDWDRINNSLHGSIPHFELNIDCLLWCTLWW